MVLIPLVLFRHTSMGNNYIRNKIMLQDKISLFICYVRGIDETTLINVDIRNIANFNEYKFNSNIMML